MNKKLNRFLSVLVAVLMLLGSLPASVFASGSTESTTTVTAKVVAYTVTVLTPHPGGTVNIVAPTTIYEGDEVSFTPVPEPGYALKSIVWYTTDASKATDITDDLELVMPGADVNVKVEFAQLFSVSFDLQGHGSAISSITDVMDGSTVKTPTAPTASGYTFGGWYKEAGCKTAWNFGADKVSKNTTLYAKWIEDSVPKKAISGNVTEGGKGVADATVELFLGTIKVAATVTDEDGKYSFENVENGTYNIVVTNGDGKTKTEMATISGVSATVDVELPVSEISSKVEHKGNEVSGSKSDISKTVVGGLEKVAEKHKPENDVDKVTVKLTVEPKADTGTAEQQAIKEKAGEGKKVEFIDLSLMMQTNNGEPQDIGDKNDELLTIVIPFDFTNVDVTSVKVIRNHKGNTSTLGDSSNKNEYGEYAEIDATNRVIILHVMKFSEYAIAYFENTEPTGECIRIETIKLKENGTYGLKLGCSEKGEFTFTKNGSGWNIQNKDGKYLGMKDGKLVIGDTAFAWTYKNGTFSTSVTEKQTVVVNKHGGLLDWLFGWDRGYKKTTKDVTKTYYLSTVKNGEKLSTCSVGAELYMVVSGEHEYGGWTNCKDGVNHKHVCKYCGKVETEEHSFDKDTHKCVCGVFDPSATSIDVTATYSTKTQKKSYSILGWLLGRSKCVTTYTATVKVNAEGFKVTKVEVSANQNKGWTKSCTFTSDAKIEQFFVRVTTNDGAKHLFRVVDGIGYPAN